MKTKQVLYLTKIKKWLSFLCLCLSMLLVSLLANTNWTMAAQKRIIQIACIDIQKVINNVASDRVLRQLLENNKSDFLQSAEQMSKEIKRLKQTLHKERNKLSRQRITSIEKEIINKTTALKQLLGQGSSYIQQAERNLSSGVLRNLYNIVKAVAIREGYSLVLEKGSAIIYVDKSLDITMLVIAELQKEKNNLLKK